MASVKKGVKYMVIISSQSFLMTFPLIESYLNRKVNQLAYFYGHKHVSSFKFIYSLNPFYKGNLRYIENTV